jgi:hypothetical protein
MAVRGTASDNAKWELSYRYLTGQIDRATHRSILMHQLRSDLKLGVEWNPGASEVGFVANWRAVPESQRRPAVIFGTSSDRIGTPEGQSYFVTISKSLHHETGLPVAPYVSAAYSTFENRMLYPFGVNVAIGSHWSSMLINDGVHTHLSATYAWDRFAVTVLLVERKDVGFTIGARFPATR